MNEQGISLEEACETNAIGTAQDYQRNCNPDGTVRTEPKETTLIVPGSSNRSVSVQNTLLYSGVGFVALLIAIILGLSARHFLKKK
ncbi:MAG TPA: hypothetical protein VK694_04145 [Verrucomicrobiae bacterium]|nr:hypothetical protein [Verrucomicrobiae bacterium]